MDIVIEKKNRLSFFKHKKFGLVFSTLFLAAFGCFIFLTLKNPSIKRGELTIEQVKYGHVSIRITGSGKLYPQIQKIITAKSEGTVEEVLLKPGAEVAPKDVVMRLHNPILIQDSAGAQFTLSMEKANYRQAQFDNEREFLAQQALLAELEMLTAVSVNELAAKIILNEKHLVSTLDFQRSKIQSEQLKKRLDIERNRLNRLSDIHSNKLSIQSERIDLQKKLIKLLQDKMDGSNVKAEIAGVVQRVFVELGQTVASGEQLALVGSNEKLIAMIEIPQGEVNKLNFGDEAMIHINNKGISARISRIDPVVTDGSVIVETEIYGDLPNNARPELAVFATINVEKDEKSLYIKTPDNQRTGNVGTYFVLSSNGKTAKPVTVTFGSSSGEYIEILSGAAEGDSLIVAAPIDLHGLSEISLK